MATYTLSVKKFNHFTATKQKIISNTDYYEKSQKQSLPQTFLKTNNFTV